MTRAASTKVTPLTPSRASYRFLHKLIRSTIGGKVSPTPEDYAVLCRVFARAGGSWKGVFTGSLDDVTLLKRLLSVAYKEGFLTKPDSWT